MNASYTLTLKLKPWGYILKRKSLTNIILNASKAYWVARLIFGLNSKVDF